VRGVDRILNMQWGEILPPPRQMSVSSYLTAVTKVNDELVGIIDVEKILGEVRGTSVDISADVASAAAVADKSLPILIVDDSSTARLMIARTLEKLGIQYHMAKDGQEALELLQQWVGEGTPVAERLALVISDIEMPRMDGYTLTSEIRKDERLRGLYVLLHSSLSGVFNDAMVKKVGADRFLAKFNPDELGQVVSERLRCVGGKAAAAGPR
jgi:two-component system chemotaxis response regulator CheV